MNNISNTACIYDPLSTTCIHDVTALGVLCCFALFVCLTLLASFFLPSRLLLNMYMLCCFALFVCLTLLASFFLSSFSSLIKHVHAVLLCLVCLFV